jgi:hypothetical protein
MRSKPWCVFRCAKRISAFLRLLSNWQLRACEQIITGNERLLGQKHFLIGVTCLRNEALILRDTLDYVGKHVDAIIAYDDASTDRTLEILRRHIQARRIAEARHREFLSCF